MPEAIWISFAFVIGLLVKGIGLPPLVGYLAAGFVLSGLSATTSITAEPTDVLAHIAHLGVLLLLFTVGLKLKLRSIVSPEVIGGSLLWAFSYVFRVFSKDMTYSTQLKQYEDAVIQKRFEELEDDEVDALLGEIERESAL